ncbi:PTS sugar transporter subunit IIA [bacterium]|nr:PTS sugar transporter subunit IIA [bacterium]
MSDYHRIHELIHSGNTICRLNSTLKDDVLLELIDQMEALKAAPEARTKLAHAIKEREQLCSTGVGNGIAIPHARNALVGLVDHAVMVFGRSPEGISFDSIDKEPCFLFFLVVAPNVREHLQIMARLSKILRDPRLRKNLLTSDTPERVHQLIKDAESDLD